MNFRIIIRKTSQGKPTWYFYTGEKYLGCLFLTSETEVELKEIIEDGNWGGNVEWVDGPGFTQNSAVS